MSEPRMRLEWKVLPAPPGHDHEHNSRGSLFEPWLRPQHNGAQQERWVTDRKSAARYIRQWHSGPKHVVQPGRVWRLGRFCFRLVEDEAQ